LLTRWFRIESAKAYRRTRQTVAAVIVHFVETMTGVRAVQGFRREGRNQEIFEEVNDHYRLANLRAFRLVGLFMPGIKLLGNVTVAIVLFYGAKLAYDGEITVGVLAAFLLYLRQFFEPMQEISQFYNTFQSASAPGRRSRPSSARRPTPLPAPRGEVRVEPSTSPVARPAVLSALDRRACGPDVGAGGRHQRKTTLARFRQFYGPNATECAAGQHRSAWPRRPTLRRAVVMVTQENFPFGGGGEHPVQRPGRPQTSNCVQPGGDQPHVHPHFRRATTRMSPTAGGRLSAGQRAVGVARGPPRPGVLTSTRRPRRRHPSGPGWSTALRTILADRTADHRYSRLIESPTGCLGRRTGVETDHRSHDRAGGGRFSDSRACWILGLNGVAVAARHCRGRQRRLVLSPAAFRGTPPSTPGDGTAVFRERRVLPGRLGAAADHNRHRAHLTPNPADHDQPLSCPKETSHPGTRHLPVNIGPVATSEIGAFASAHTYAENAA
jgi:hypothetical protein